MSKKNKIDSKEDKNLTWLPIGAVIGSILSVAYNNIMFLAIGAIGGLLLDTLIGCIRSEEDRKIEFKKENKNKSKSKKNK